MEWKCAPEMQLISHLSHGNNYTSWSRTREARRYLQFIIINSVQKTVGEGSSMCLRVGAEHRTGLHSRRRRSEQRTCARARYLCMQKRNQKGSCFFGRKCRKTADNLQEWQKRRASGCVIRRAGATGHGCGFTQPTCRCQRHRNSGRVDNERRRGKINVAPREM